MDARPDDAIRAYLRRLLNALGPAGIRAKVSTPLIHKTRTLSPSDLALEILWHVHSVDPAYLEKKLLPKLRKSISPLEDWEKEITSWPLLPE